MKTYTIRYVWFKIIKSIIVSEINFNYAIKEFNRLLPHIQKQAILTIKIIK
jgi:hypothetical protein